MFTTASASTPAPVASPAARQGIRSPAKRGTLLPPKIGSALAMINTDPRFRELSLTARNVLMFLVQVTAVKDPLKPSWAHKETIADYLGIGEATVYRMLNILIENGFIERLEQERKSRNGRFAVARLRLTPTCCAILGLAARKSASDANVVEPAGVPTRYTPRRDEDAENHVENIHGENNVDESATVCIAVPPRKTAGQPVSAKGENLGDAGSPKQKMIDGHMNILPSADQQTQSSKQSRPAGCRKPEPGQGYLRVPREFFWLIDENRLTAPQTCKLMREFSTRGQRLGDAVSVLAKRLREIPKDKTYAYLASLAKGQTDFTWLRKEQARSAAAIRKKEFVQEKAANLQDMAGKYLFSSNQTHLFLLRGGHAEAWWPDNGRMRRGTQPINVEFAEAFAKGRLSELSQDRAAEILAKWGKFI